MLDSGQFVLLCQWGGGGVTRPCARARQAKRVLTQGRTGAYRGVQGRTGAYRGVQGRTGAYRGVQGRTGASRDKSLKMT